MEGFEVVDMGTTEGRRMEEDPPGDRPLLQHRGRRMASLCGRSAFL